MIINKNNNNGSGPWGNGGNQNPWGKRPNSNGTPPDVDQMLKESKDKLKKMMPSMAGLEENHKVIDCMMVVTP